MLGREEVESGISRPCLVPSSLTLTGSVLVDVDNGKGFPLSHAFLVFAERNPELHKNDTRFGKRKMNFVSVLFSQACK